MFKKDSKSLKYKKWYYAFKRKYQAQFQSYNWDHKPMESHILMRVSRLMDKLYERAFDYNN